MYVMRASYVRYTAEEEHDGVGWVDKDGGVTSNWIRAKLYTSEAEAWDHAVLSDLAGHDDDGTPWCWTEEVT